MPDGTAVSCAKTAEPIEIPFGLWTQWVYGLGWSMDSVGPRKHIKWGQFLGDMTCPGMRSDTSALSCAKWLN